MFLLPRSLNMNTNCPIKFLHVSPIECLTPYVAGFLFNIHNFGYFRWSPTTKIQLRPRWTFVRVVLVGLIWWMMMIDDWLRHLTFFIYVYVFVVVVLMMMIMTIWRNVWTGSNLHYRQFIVGTSVAINSRKRLVRVIVVVFFYFILNFLTC